MKIPQRLQSLLDEGLIDAVQRQLMSAKEAMVYVVRSGDESRPLRPLHAAAVTYRIAFGPRAGQNEVTILVDDDTFHRGIGRADHFHSHGRDDRRSRGHTERQREPRQDQTSKR